MELGAFSVSLAVDNLVVSREFYAKLGFEMMGGDGENWAILVNGETVIGLFQGMFEKNILTFNPGWQGPGLESDTFTDVRELKAAMVSAGLSVEQDQTGETDEGPASFVVIDPDGNPILIDQHR